MFTTVLVIVLINLTSLALTAWLARPDAPIRMLDHPNERSLHARPTPRTGGLAICAALLLGWLVSTVLYTQTVVPAQMVWGAAIIAGISILDDRFGLSQLLRFVAQLGAAVVLISGYFVIQGEILPGMPVSVLFATALTLLLTLWLTNLYNFMDGMDGFAGGMAVIGFGALAVLGWGQGDLLYAGSALAVSAAAAGFLVFNFPPARIFMGDSGSTTLGFLVAAFSIGASRRGIAPAWVTLMIFSPFVVDATVTLLRRGARGEPVWRPHRSHYYQRLVQIGWGHRRTVLAEYAVMLISALAALAANGADPRVQWVMLVALAGGYGLAALEIHRLERRRNADIET